MGEYKYVGVLPIASAGESQYRDDDVRLLLMGEERMTTRGVPEIRYSSFGGGPEEDEEPVDTAIREFFEESMGVPPAPSGSGVNGLSEEMTIETDTGGKVYLYMLSHYNPDLPMMFESLMHIVKVNKLKSEAGSESGAFEATHIKWVKMATLKRIVGKMKKKSYPIESNDSGGELVPIRLDNKFVDVLSVLFEAYDFRK